MALQLKSLFDDAAPDVRARVIAIYALLAVFNLGAWAWAFIAFRHFPLLLGTALLAYSFGLRHAVDADHIAAIDNVTSKLMQDGKRPVAVGFMFSLGHSTVVVLGAAAIAGATLTLQYRVENFRSTGELIGTLVSAFFLFAIAIANLIVLRSIYRAFVRVRRGGAYVEEDFDMLLGNRGFLRAFFARCSSSSRAAGTCIRSVFCSDSALTPPPKSASSAFPPRKLRKASRSDRSSFFRCSSPRACR